MSIDDGATRRLVDLGIAGYADPEEIGRGGFAVVYRARRVAFDQDVAIKVLDGAVAPGEAVDRFERERRILGVLAHHPNIVTVYDGGVAAGGAPYLVMEYLGGGPLSARLERDGPLDVWRAVDVVVRLCGALETAHRSGVLHRDIKPENVLVSRYGDPVLADFGIARIRGAVRTRSGVVTATLAHAPPEVLDGRPATARSDVYSLASTLFALLTGAPPFLHGDDEGVSPMIARVFRDPVPDLRPRGVPDEVCALLEQAMAKDADERPDSALEWGRAFQLLQRGAGRAVSPLVVEDVDGRVTDVTDATYPATVRSTGDRVEQVGDAAAPAPDRSPPSPAAPPPTGAGAAGPTRLLRPGRLVVLVAVLFVLVPLAGVGYLLLAGDRPPATGPSGPVPDPMPPVLLDHGFSAEPLPDGSTWITYAVRLKNPNPSPWVLDSVMVTARFTDRNGVLLAEDRGPVSVVRPGATAARSGLATVDGASAEPIRMAVALDAVRPRYVTIDSIPPGEVTLGPATTTRTSVSQLTVACTATSSFATAQEVALSVVFLGATGTLLGGYPLPRTTLPGRASTPVQHSLLLRSYDSATPQCHASVMGPN